MVELTATPYRNNTLYTVDKKDGYSVRCIKSSSN